MSEFEFTHKEFKIERIENPKYEVLRANIGVIQKIERIFDREIHLTSKKGRPFERRIYKNRLKSYVLADIVLRPINFEPISDSTYLDNNNVLWVYFKGAGLQNVKQQMSCFELPNEFIYHANVSPI